MLCDGVCDGDFGDRQSVREERREGRQVCWTTHNKCAAIAIRIETAGRCGHKRTAETWGAVVDPSGRLIARARRRRLLRISSVIVVEAEQQRTQVGSGFHPVTLRTGGISCSEAH